MLGTHDLGLFIVAGLMLNITPGQDTFYILGRTVAQGRSAGVYSVLGIAVGGLVHTVFAALGLSAVLAASRTAYTVVTLAGAAYLVWLGIRMLRAGTAEAGIEVFQRESPWTIFRSGLLTNVLNPKVAIFFMAFLPQFVSADAPSRIGAFLFLGSVFVVNGTLWCLVLVGAAAMFSARMRSKPQAMTWFTRAAGLVFVGLGARLAVGR